jgi:riboflavin kinase/FMN adenylyltransferase
MTLEQRLEAFERAGVGACVLIGFTDSFHRLTGAAFLTELSHRMEPAKLVVGFNFRCGYQMEYGPGEIEAFFDPEETVVEIASAVKSEEKVVSSSRLRSLLAAGDLDAFARISGREFVLDLREAVAEDSERTVRLEIEGDRIGATGQAVPGPGTYRGVGVDSRGTEIDLTVTSNYLEGPLATSSSLLYIVRK